MRGGDDADKRRQAKERAQYLRVTTDLDADEALAVAWKEMGYAAPAIARRCGCAPVTIEKRLDRAIAQYGLEAAHPTEEAERGDLEAISPAYFEALSEGVIDLYRQAAVQHPQHVPEGCWEIVQSGTDEDVDDEDGDQSQQKLITDGGRDIVDEAATRHTDSTSVDPTRVRGVVGEILRYYHRQVDATIDDHTETGTHPERPTTAREYFQDEREWTDETIDAALLGWAPPADEQGDLGELLAWDCGYSAEEIRATGLFYEDLTPKWQGRYVLPYNYEIWWGRGKKRGADSKRYSRRELANATRFRPAINGK